VTKRSQVHITGLNNLAFEQRCDRCHCVLVPCGDKSWEPGTAVAYFGHGQGLIRMKLPITIFIAHAAG
jgi:hypothetical protein